jgi:plasmid maintenance system killer protein
MEYILSKKLENAFANQTEMQKRFGDHSRKIQQIFDDIQLSKNLEELRKTYPSLKELKGDRRQTFSIKITGNWRLILKPDWEAPNSEEFLKDDGGINYSKVDYVEIVDVEDYH